MEPARGHLSLRLPGWFVDRFFWLLAALAFLLDGGMALYIRLRYTSLPERMAIHFGSNGVVDRVGFRSELFILPVIGLTVNLANLALSAVLYQHDKQACRALMVLSVLVQLLLFGAAIQLVR
ncbi:MAG: DUF1648 domain-containing protein [Chloroflexota bacterium]|nr:DUF1648 domain-containing protein [Chloroflexota bacterium]